MNIRYPVVAGSFYESSPTSCKHHVEKLLAAAQVPDNLPGRLFGGLVPHAGWMFSGRVAALTLKALHKATGGLTTLVLFGAVHHYGAAERGEVQVDEALRELLEGRLEMAITVEAIGELLAKLDTITPVTMVEVAPVDLASFDQLCLDMQVRQ